MPTTTDTLMTDADIDDEGSEASDRPVHRPGATGTPKHAQLPPDAMNAWAIPNVQDDGEVVHVRNMHTGYPLPREGAPITRNSYWDRRVLDGVVTIHDSNPAAVPAPTLPPSPARRNEDDPKGGVAPTPRMPKPATK